MTKRLLVARLARQLAIAINHATLPPKKREAAIKTLRDYEIRVGRRLERKREFAEEDGVLETFDEKQVESQMPLLVNMMEYTDIPPGVRDVITH